MKAGWAVSTLGETCEMYQPKTITAKEMMLDGPYPVFGANGVIGRYDQFNHEEPQLLITCRGATCGTVNVSEPKSWITGNAMVVRPKSANIDLRFLEYLFRGGMDISTAITGAAQPQITRTNLNPIEIQYPLDSKEQKRIVTLLDEACDGIATAKANAEKNLQSARAIFESHLQSVFSQHDAKWSVSTLGEVCQFENGDRGKNYPNRVEYVDSGVPWINTGHIEPDGTLSVQDMNYITQQKYDSLRSGKVKPGDLVYCLRGATLGKTAFVTPFTTGAVASSLVIIRPGKAINGRYLYYFLTSPVGRGLIKHYENGAAQPNLGAKSVAAFKVPLPSLIDQSNIVQRLDALASETQSLGAIYQQKITALDELKKSLLHRAFNGDL